MKVFLWIVGIVVVVIVVGMAMMGGFQKVVVTSEEQDSIKMIYVEYKGPYNKVMKSFEQVYNYLNANKITHADGIGEYLDNPMKVKSTELRSNVGYIVDKDYKDSGVYKFKSVPSQLYAIAVFKGSPSVGPMLVYPAMNKWIVGNGYEVSGPCFEIYSMQDKKTSTKYLMPIKKK